MLSKKGGMINITLFTESTLFFLFLPDPPVFYFLPDPLFKKESLEVSIIVLIRI